MSKQIITAKKDSLEKYKTFIKEDIQTKDIQTKDIQTKGKKKIIKIKRKRSSPKIKKKPIIDINDIEQKMLKMKSIQMPTQNKEQSPKVQAYIQPKPNTQVDTPVDTQVKPPVEVQVDTQVKVKRPSRSNRRSNSRNKSKVKGRKVSIKSRVFNKADIDKVESKIKEIRGKKTSDIKIELKNQGIKVSGKSDRLLKDIYLYSKMCNIQIQHEK